MRNSIASIEFIDPAFCASSKLSITKFLTLDATFIFLNITLFALSVKKFSSSTNKPDFLIKDNIFTLSNGNNVFDIGLDNSILVCDVNIGSFILIFTNTISLFLIVLLSNLTPPFFLLNFLINNSLIKWTTKLVTYFVCVELEDVVCKQFTNDWCWNVSETARPYSKKISFDSTLS